MHKKSQKANKKDHGRGRGRLGGEATSKGWLLGGL